MQVRLYTGLFIKKCIILTMIALPIILSSNGLASEIIFGQNLFITAIDTTGQPGDSIRIVYDSAGIPIDTIRNDSTQSKPLFDDLIDYNADDSVRFSIQEKKVYLYGNGFVKYLTTELRADYIELDMDKKLAMATGVPDSVGKLKGTPKFKDGGQEFESTELHYNFDTKKGYVTEIITQEGEGYIQGKTTKKMSDSVYCVKHGMYTTCDEHDHPHFGLNMSKAKMIKDKKIFVGFTNLELEGIPLPIFIPFGFFPITKKATSGIIMPTYGEERMRGFNLRGGGYYIYINDYIDMNITGDIYTNGSWGLQYATQYRKRYKFNGNLNFTISKNYVSEKGLPDYQESSDWSVRWTHTQDGKANPYSSFSASVDMSSANNNYYNANTVDGIANQRKQSSISWSKKWPESPFSLSGSFNHSQNSRDSSIAITLPNLSLRMTQIYPFRKKGKSGEMKWYDNIGVSYSAELRNSIQTKEDKLFKSSFERDWSNGFKHNIPISLQFKIAKDVTFTPSLNYNGYLNLKTIEKIWIPDTSANGGQFITRDVPGLNYSHDYSASGSIGYTPTIYGMFMFKPGCKVVAIRHMIRPSISASYTPAIKPLGNYKKSYFDGEKEVEYDIHEGLTYRPNTTGGKQSGSISFSLDNNVEMKVRNDKDTTGDEEFKKVKLLESFRLSTSYNPFADSMNFSNISISARTKILNNKVDLNFSGTIDPYAIDTNNVRYNKYHGKLGRLTNATISTNFSFSADNGQNKEKKNDLVGGFYDDYMDFDVPWNISISYNFTYSRPSPYRSPTISQIVNFSGDLSLTPKWKLTFQSGYDIKNKEVTSTSFSVTRDLHCWEMTFNCMPFGQHQSYNFEIHVRSSLLRDLKLTKRDSWYDRRL
ncbi:MULTISPECIES: putative LPS assembly protein LptD [Butyricimonas]|uniref:Lipopolysaccharide assembly outer membrane protein LptD (OstA) n=2 Tax=Butyricimonas paravirosa TaxID=1472417 RepID=A0A7X5YF92_9BACT|nr:MULTISPECIES: putative LPS assembly protein LptD [Odoribacteraceae]NJC19328.1 lipopolysaccharide assembly outer membrane protein LptD (OstA) [Butyricimonas paravirosa]